MAKTSGKTLVALKCIDEGDMFWRPRYRMYINIGYGFSLAKESTMPVLLEILTDLSQTLIAQGNTQEVQLIMA